MRVCVSVCGQKVVSAGGCTCISFYLQSSDSSPRLFISTVSPWLILLVAYCPGRITYFMPFADFIFCILISFTLIFTAVVRNPITVTVLHRIFVFFPWLYLHLFTHSLHTLAARQGSSEKSLTAESVPVPLQFVVTRDEDRRG